MPKQDKTGPSGMGSGTGSGFGPCVNKPGPFRQLFGFNRGFCQGLGRFWRFGFQASPKEEKQMLEKGAKVLEDELKAVKDRLDELEEK